MREPDTRREDRRGERGGRRLPVRRGDEGGAERQPAREPVDRLRIELPEQLAGERRAAARPGEAGEPAHGARRGDLERQRDARAHAASLATRPAVDPSFE